MRLRRLRFLRASMVGCILWVLCLSTGPVAQADQSSVGNVGDRHSRWTEPGVLHVKVPPKRSMRGAKDAVFVVGDSLTFDTWVWGGLKRVLRSAQLRVSGVDAQGGMQIVEARERIEAARQYLPGIVLLAVGANDVTHGTSPARFRREVERIVDALDGRTLVVVDVFARSDSLLAGRERRLNDVLATLAHLESNVTLARWTVTMSKRPDYVLPSDPFQLHLTREGVLARVQFYVDSVNSVRGRR
jgi:hypothetical protein